MASYKDRLTGDLDRWIAGGLVQPDKREAILAQVPDTRRIDAATALAWVGSILLGAAVIAFVASNSEVIPRLLRFGLILSVFAAAAGAAAWMARQGRDAVANGLLTFAALVFASAIGLSGQIFDITGDPHTALLFAGAVALALAVAGEASGPAIAALLFIAFADFTGDRGRVFGGDDGHLQLQWLLLAAPLCVAGSIWKRSAPLAHAAALGFLLAVLRALLKLDHVHAVAFVAVSAGLGAMALFARRYRDDEAIKGEVFQGWLIWGALAFFLASGFDIDHAGWKVAHRLVWLGVAGGLIALGRHDRSAVITGAGVLGLLAAIATLLSDLGFGLMASAGLFFVSAIVALGVGLMLKRRRAA